MPDHPRGCRDIRVEEPQGRPSKIRYHTIHTVLRLRGFPVLNTTVNFPKYSNNNIRITMISHSNTLKYGI